jgi:hypothetical protein
MNTSARITYWKFTLRFITKADVAAWADKQVEAGHVNGELFDLSTCSQLDDNVIMGLLTDLSSDYDRESVEKAFIKYIIDHFSKGKSGEQVNCIQLADFENISDLSGSAKYALASIGDEISLSREGIYGNMDNESQAVVDRLSKLLI